MVDLAGSVGESVRTVRTGGTVALVGMLSGTTANLDLGPVVTRAIRLQAVTEGSRAMPEDMVRAIELHRMGPVLELAPQRIDSAAGVIGALPTDGHFGKVCTRAWDG